MVYIRSDTKSKRCRKTDCATMLAAFISSLTERRRSTHSTYFNGYRLKCNISDPFIYYKNVHLVRALFRKWKEIVSNNINNKFINNNKLRKTMIPLSEQSKNRYCACVEYSGILNLLRVVCMDVKMVLP